MCEFKFGKTKNDETILLRIGHFNNFEKGNSNG